MAWNSSAEGGRAGMRAATEGLAAATARTGSYRQTWSVVGVGMAAYFLVICSWQWLSKANLASFSAYPDEASHYISGLLIRDYVFHGFPRSPYQYAVAYYAHVPFFAIGYWPPLFYAAEGLWMSLLGDSRAAVLPFVALITAAS